MKHHALAAPLILLLAACDETPSNPGGDSRPAGDGSGGFTSLVITPKSPSLKTGLKGGQTLQFTARGVKPGGASVQLTSVTWGLDNTVIGTVSAGGLFTASGRGGGGRITASLGSLGASVNLKVKLEDTVMTGGATAADLKGLQQPPTANATRAPVIIYPEHDTMIPANLPPMTVQWRRGDAANARFGLRLTCANLDLLVASRQLSWKATKPIWSAIIGSCKGSAVKAVAAGGGASGPSFVGTGALLNVSSLSAPGTIYYWATGPEKSLKNGVVRIDAGSDQATDYYTQANNGSKRCSGCHAVTRDGAKMVFTEYPLKSWENYAKGVDVKTRSAFLPSDKLLGNFFAFSPTGDRLLYAEAGGVTIRRVADQKVLSSFTSLGGRYASHPDWSPVADRLAFAIYPKKYDYAENFCQGSVAVADLPAAGAAWKHKVLVQSNGADDSNYYPSFSPDGKYVVFNKAGRHNNTKLGEYDCDCYANPDARLYIIPAAGGSPVALTRANASGKITNSWAKWAPASGSVSVWWLAFSSTRDYGAVLVNSTKKDIRGEKHPQIWVTAVRTDLLAAGKDPSSPAFWLPGQRTDSGNHIPFWTRTLK